MFSLIPVAEASAHVVAAQGFVTKINQAILFPLITLMMALAFLVFLWGAFEYVKNSNNESARETGRNHLMYGVIGMLVMLSALAILNIAAGTFGLSVPSSGSFAPETSLRPLERPDRAPGNAVPSTVTPITTSPSTVVLTNTMTPAEIATAIDASGLSYNERLNILSAAVENGDISEANGSTAIPLVRFDVDLNR